MKLSKEPKNDSVIPEIWQCYDGCAVCRLFAKAAIEGREISGKELEEAFAEAEKQEAG